MYNISNECIDVDINNQPDNRMYFIASSRDEPNNWLNKAAHTGGGRMKQNELWKCSVIPPGGTT